MHLERKLLGDQLKKIILKDQRRKSSTLCKGRVLFLIINKHGFDLQFKAKVDCHWSIRFNLCENRVSRYQY